MDKRTTKSPENEYPFGQYWEIQTRMGYTSEGRKCEVNLYFPEGSPDGTKAQRITGWYFAADGFDTFDVIFEDDLPNVVFDGNW